MAKWDILKQSIAFAIKANNNQEITASILNDTLINIVKSLGENATFIGVATKATNPGVHDGSVFYLASESGIYPNFGRVEVTNELACIIWDGTSWRLENTGIPNSEGLGEIIAEIQKRIDELIIDTDGIKDEAITISKLNADVLNYIASMGGGGGGGTGGGGGILLPITTNMIGDKQVTEEKLSDAVRAKLGSATYNTQMADSTKMPNAVGGIKKDTTAESLKGKSFTELFDALLFPTVLPVAGAISATIAFKNYTIPKAVGAAAPTEANFTTTFNRGKFTLNGVQQTQNVAGVATNESIYVNDVEASLPTSVPLGNTTYKYHVEYGAGDVPLDSNGNECPNLQNKGGTKESSSITLNGTYPFYIIQNGTKTEELIGCVVNGTKGWKITLSTSHNINIESTAAGALEIIVPGTLTALRMVDPFSSVGYSDMLGDFKEVEMTSTELANYPSGAEYTKYVSTIVFGTRKIYSGTIEIVESK